MQSLTVIEVLKQVFTSWQVIVSVIVIVLYLNLVFFVSRAHRRPNKIRRLSVKSNIPSSKEKENADEKKPAKSINTNDELGLEEE